MAGGKLKEAEYHSDLQTDLFTEFDDVRPHQFRETVKVRIVKYKMF